MRQLNKNTFNDFDNPQLIWEVFGELLDLYSDQNFSAKQLAYELNFDVKLINKILHRLKQKQAVICTGIDHWGVKIYRINDTFTN